MERWGKGGIAKRGAYEVRGVSLLTYNTPHRRKTAEQSATDTTDGKQKKDNLSIILLAVRRGLEPLTPCVTGTYSNQLN